MTTNTLNPESGIARRDFLRVIGIAGLALGANLEQCLAEPAAPLPAGDLIVGLEIGTSKVCVVVAERQSACTMKLLGIGHAFSRGVRKGEFVDSEWAGRSVIEALADAEAKSDVMIRSVHLAVTGRHVTTQMENSIRCLKGFGIEVERIVFAPEASAEGVLDLNEKKLGALVIDMGGGTTDYAVYAEGAVKHSGCLQVAGDHITNDLSLGLRIPMRCAEELKIEEGSARCGQVMLGERIVLRSERDFGGKEIERGMLNTIVHCRVRETFELVRKRLQTRGVRCESLGTGVHLTGGCSMLRGIDELAQEVFGLPAHLARVKGILSGPSGTIDDPRHSCAIGLVKFVA